MTKFVSIMSIVCIIVFSSCSGTGAGSMEVDLTQLLKADESNIIGIQIGDSLVDVEQLISNDLTLGVEVQEHNLKKYVLEGEYQLLEIPCRIYLEFVDDKVNSISIVLDDRTEAKDKEERFKDFETIVEKLKEHYSEPNDEASNSYELEYGKFDTLIYRWLEETGESKLSIQVHYTVRDENSANITVIWGITEEKEDNGFED